jgi:FtsP/CotA-like multicopper oxidase with cupredoxin domain
LLTAASATLALAGCAKVAAPPTGRLTEIRAGNRPLTLTAAPHTLNIGHDSVPAWVYREQPLPVLRLKQGEEVQVTLANALGEHTSIHWHGIRGPNAMDGVPYLTQAPVQPGAHFAYRFTPPDTGTFFFHPHCNTAEQLGRGLVGALVVEDGVSFDDDVVLLIKDWRLAPDGGFLPFLTTAGASRAGSFGTVRTVNGIPSPKIAVPGKSQARLRLINTDSARICEIGVKGAQVIAIDGNAVTPFALDTWRLGPAMRLDLSLRVPASEPVEVIDYFSATPVTLATLLPSGSDDAPKPVAALEPTRFQEPDLAKGWQHTLELDASAAPAGYPDIPPVVLPDGRRIDLADSLCLAQGTFWALDGKSWPERDHRRLPPPLFTFARGESVVLTLSNETSRTHPIHIHGHTMKVLSADRLKRPVHRADTVLVLPNERVQVAFVADNPGNWMIHCHVIEHQETGMMGWFRVS